MTTPDITVIDAMPGTGKTTWVQRHVRETAINEFGRDEGERSRWLYIAVTEAERDRMKDACGLTPRFHDPYPLQGRKLNALHEMVLAGENIVSTHSLLTRMNMETLRALQARPYHLIIDEELSCVAPFAIKTDDLNALLRSFCDVLPDGTLVWRSDYKHGRFEDLRGLVEAGNLVLMDGTILLWRFPVSFLKVFQSVTILTYQFEGSLMATYLKSYGISYRTMALAPDRETLVPLLGQREEALARLRPLIHVIDDPVMTSFGYQRGREKPFSKAWMTRVASGADEAMLRRIKTSTARFFKEARGDASDAMWSTYKSLATNYKGHGYSRAFVPLNLRATNDYRGRSNLAWLGSLYMNPYLKRFLERDGTLSADEDGYCLSTLIQWIWRSQIRNPEPGPINVYLPAERPRKLLLEWLSGTRMPTEVVQAPAEAA